MPLLRTIIHTFALLLLALAGASAATLPVPSAQYPTIQAGIDAAAPGDTVLVADGTYVGPGNVDLDFGGKAITVSSVSGAASTIIDCQSSSDSPHRGFNFHSAEPSAATVSGFTVTNGAAPSDPNGPNYGGGGISISGSSSPTITLCLLTANQNNGLDVYVGSSPRVSHCLFSENQRNGILVSGSAAVSDCSFTGNLYSGLEIDGSATATNCTFAANVGDGMEFAGARSGAITNCTFTANQGAGGMLVSASSPIITNCILWNDAGGEVNFADGGSAALSHCDVQGGYAGVGNINADPLFLRPSSLSATPADYGDLHLQAGSPCYGAGTASGAPLGDKDGSLRPSLPSIGAYDHARFDVDGDSHPDLLWHNTSTGQTLTWDMNDQSVTNYGSPFATVANTDWTVAATADVNGDGHPDLLWQNTRTGQVLFWLMGGTDGQQVISYGDPFATVSDTHWRVVSMADFNGDGHPDLLWENSATGQLLVWTMNGTQVLTYGSPFAQVTNTAWQVAGTADFDGDGQADLLWENSQTGQMLVWNLGGADGTSVLHYGDPFATVSDTSWHIVGTGDMNSDGHPDLLWQNTQTGDVLRWTMGGTNGQQVQQYGSPFATVTDTHWQIVGVH